MIRKLLAPLVPLYEGLSKYHRSITTESTVAQEYFDPDVAVLYTDA